MPISRQKLGRNAPAHTILRRGGTWGDSAAPFVAGGMVHTSLAVQAAVDGLSQKNKFLCRRILVLAYAHHSAKRKSVERNPQIFSKPQIEKITTFAPAMNRLRTYSPTTSRRAFPAPPAQAYAPASRTQRRGNSHTDYCSLITAHWTHTFSAKEKDTETGFSVTSLRSGSSFSLSQPQTSSVWHSLMRRFSARYY